LGAAKIYSSSAKFSWLGGILSKVHSELLQDFKIYHRTVENGTNYVWSKECDEPFQTLKKLLTTSPVLAQLDIAKPFDVYYDASGTGL
jgi:hypothetical protein